MSDLKSPVDILKLLEKSNCRECGQPTCLAFASAVMRGDKELADCPRLDPAEAARHTVQRPGGGRNQDQLLEEALDAMKQKIAALDLEEAAQRLGAAMDGGSLCIHMLGKRVCVAPDGVIHTDIHVNRWVALPLYQWIIEGRNEPPAEQWIPYRELPGGKDRVADSDPDLFDDMITIFAGNRVAPHYGSDISVVLHPLPCLPMLFCYWKPGEMPSDLNIFFDAGAERNIDIESIFTLSTGMAVMFENFAYRLK